MARIDVNFVVEKQILTQTPETYLYTGSQDYFYAIFNVDATWDNVNTIKALFVKNGVSKIVELEKCDGGYGCDIPWQMYSTTGDFKVSIYDGGRMSTNSIYVVVDEKDEIEVEESVENETYADRLMSHFSLRQVDRPDTFKIDGESRIITPPESFKNFGVESDENSNRVWFEVPQYVSGGIDLSTLNLYINFKNANGEKDKYIVEDADVADGVLYFSWVLSRKVTLYRGDISFIVCGIATNDEGEIETEWNTTLCTGPVLEGLEVDNPEAEIETVDLIDQLVSLVKSSVTTVENAVSQAEADIESARGQAVATVNTTVEDGVKAVNDAKKNAVEYIGTGVDATLTKSGLAADAKVTGTELTRRAPAIICDAEGISVSITDSANAKFKSFNIYGKTTQANVPTIEKPQSLINAGANGSVKVSVTDENAKNTQTITLSTPNGLPGVPVYTNGHYIDKNKQQWICDEIDIVNGKYIQRVREITLTGSNTTWSKSGLTTYEGYYYFYRGFGSNATVDGLLCDRLPTRYYEGAWTNNEPGEFCTIKPANDGTSMTFCINILKSRVDSYAGATIVDKFVNFMNANPFTAQYILVTPVETNLTDAEITQGRTLTSYKPVTNVGNDANAHMKVAYVSDTKRYIDNKTRDISNALKGYAEGNPVRLDDVSPVEHEMKVITSVGGAAVTRTGQNHAPITRTLSFPADNSYSVDCNIPTPFTFKCTIDVTKAPSAKNAAFIQFDYDDGTVEYVTPTLWGFVQIGSMTKWLVKRNGKTLTKLTFINWSNLEGVVSEVAIALGEKEPFYEPYVEPITYVADETGNVEGITSLYPTTVLTSDAGVTITAEYNRDINKAFAELQNAVASLSNL